MTDGVEVKFGGDTTGIEKASALTIAELGQIKTKVVGLQGTLASVSRDIVKSFGRAGAAVSGFSQGLSSEISTSITAVGGLNGVLATLRQRIAAAFSGAEGKTRAAGRGADEFGGKIRGASGATGLLSMGLTNMLGAAAAAFSVTAIIRWTSTVAAAAEKVHQLSQSLGMTTAQVGGWSAVANLAGMSTDQWASATGRLEKNMVMAASGAKRQSAVFKEMGIDVSKTKTASEALLAVAAKFEGMEDGPKKMALAMELMGAAGADMVPVLNQGKDAIAEQMAMAQKYGATMDEEFIQKALLVDDAYDEMGMAMQGLGNTLFEALAPAIVEVTNALTGMIASFHQSYEAGGVAKTMADIVVFAFKVLATVVWTAAEIFRETYAVIAAVCQAIVGTVFAMVNAVKSALSGGGMQGAANAFVSGIKGTGTAVVNELNKAAAGQKNFAAGVSKLWVGGGSPASPRSRPKGGGGLGIEGLGGGGKGAGRKERDERVQEWQAELDAKIEAEIGFFKDSKTLELGFWQEKLAIVEAGSKAHRDIEKKIFQLKKSMAREALAVELESIDTKMDATRDDYNQTMALHEQKMAAISRTYGEDSSEYRALLREKARMTRDHNQELLQMERDRVELQGRIAEGAEAAAAEILAGERDMEVARIEQAAQFGRINAQERHAALAAVRAQQIADEQAHEQKLYGIKLNGLKAQLALENLKPQERLRINSEIEQLEATHLQAMQVLTAQAGQAASQAQMGAADVMFQRWQSRLGAIGQAANGMFQNVYNGTMTFRDAFLQACDQILFAMVNTAIESAVQWMAAEHVKTAATVTGTATRGAVEEAGAAKSVAMSAMVAVKDIGAKAASAAAGAYAAIAGIPVVGPFLAPAMAAAAFAGVLALGSSIASAEGGWDKVPKDGMMTELHKDEMVLPADIAGPLRNNLKGFSAAPIGSGGSLASSAAEAGSSVRENNSSKTLAPAFNYQPNISSGGSASLESMLKSDGAAMRRWLNNQIRNGKLKVS